MKNGRSFASKVNNKFKTSALAAVFTSYRSRERRSILDSRFGERVLSPSFKVISRLISSSLVTSLLSRLAAFFLSLRLKLYGAMLFAFGVYSAATSVAEQFILSDTRGVSGIIFGVALALSSLPLISSDDTLSSALSSSRVGDAVCRLTGIRREATEVDAARGRASYGFLVGAVIGTLTFFVSPFAIVKYCLASVVLWLIMTSPEFGVVAMAVALPLSGTATLTVLVGATALSFLIKVIRGKRFVTFETLDAAAVGLLFVFLFSSLSHGGGNAPLQSALFMSAYFLAASLIRNPDRSAKAAGAVVLGGAVSGALVLIGTVGGMFVPVVRYTVGDLFADTLTGERLSGIDASPLNMIMVLCVPIALSRLLATRGGKRAAYAASLVLTLYPIVAARSAYALFAAALGVTFVLAVRKPRFILLPVGAGAAAVILRFAAPALFGRISAYFTSHFDKFVSMRAQTWSSASNLPVRTYIAGIGFEKEAFTVAAGGASGGHFYNTFLKFWIETGLAGAVLLALFTWFFITASLKIIDRIDLARRTSAIKSASPAKGDGQTNLPFALEFALLRRMSVAGPASSAVALMIYGVANNVWSDARVFLFFWLICGLAAGAVRGVREEIKDHEASWSDSAETEVCADVDVRVE